MSEVLAVQDYPLGRISMDSHVTHHRKTLQASRGEERNHLEIGQIILFIRAFPQEKLFNRAKLLECYQCLTGLTGDAPATLGIPTLVTEKPLSLELKRPTGRYRQFQLAY